MTTGSLWYFHKDEVNDDDMNENNNDNFRVNKEKETANKPFEYKTKTIGSTSNNNNNRLNAEIVVPLKYLSNFGRSLNLLLIKCQIELDLPWSEYCVRSDLSKTPEVVKPIQQMQHYNWNNVLSK